MDNIKKNKVNWILLLIIFFLFLLMIIHLMNFDYKREMSTLPPKDALYLDTKQPIEKRVENLLSFMTLEEKIGQMTLVEKDSLKEKNDISKYHLGALLSGSGSKPELNTSKGWKDMIDEYQKESQI